MSQAKALKLKEYGTDILSHGNGTPDQVNVRVNGTFQSSIMDSRPELELRHAKSRERQVVTKPLTSQITRTSYQDSNIFGYKDTNNHTVQPGCCERERGIRERNNNTFVSRVFSPEKQPSDERPLSRGRCEEKWSSTVFAGPQIDPPSRKKLGRPDSGTEKMFGGDRVDLGNTSNKLAVIGQPRKPNTKFTPVRKEKTAEQRKNEELYGRSAVEYGCGKKGDGTLMMSGGDWKNTQQKHTNSPIKQQSSPTGNHREMKYNQLQSSILANEDPNNRLPFDPNVEKAAFATDAAWTTAGGAAKLINKGNKVDTFQKMKQQQASSVFDLPEYHEHAPMKKNTLDVNNMNDKQRKHDHMYSDILGTGPSVGARSTANLNQAQAAANRPVRPKTTRPKTKTPFIAKSKKFEQMRSTLDTHDFDPQPPQNFQTVETPEKNSAALTFTGPKSKAIKMRDLSSDVLGTGDPLAKFGQAGTHPQSSVVDLVVRNLGEHTKPEDLKRVAQVKHVISSSVDTDSIKNVCTGTGRIKLRLGAEENLDIVKLQFLKAGYGIQEYTNDTKLKSGFSNEQTLSVKSPVRKEMDAKMAKMGNLNTNNPEVFGNSSTYQKKFSTTYNNSASNSGKSANQKESMALSSWNKTKR